MNEKRVVKRIIWMERPRNSNFVETNGLSFEKWKKNERKITWFDFRANWTSHNSVYCFRCQYYIFRHPWVPAYQGVITFFVIANFTLATFMDPGVIPKGMPIRLFNRIAMRNSMQISVSTWQHHLMKIVRMSFVRLCTKTPKSMESRCAWNGVWHANSIDRRDAPIVLYAIIVSKRLIIIALGWVRLRCFQQRSIHSSVLFCYFLFCFSFAGEQLHWAKKLSILFLLSDFTIDSHAEHIFIMFILCFTS